MPIEPCWVSVMTGARTSGTNGCTWRALDLLGHWEYTSDVIFKKEQATKWTRIRLVGKRRWNVFFIRTQFCILLMSCCCTVTLPMQNRQQRLFSFPLAQHHWQTWLLLSLTLRDHTVHVFRYLFHSVMIKAWWGIKSPPSCWIDSCLVPFEFSSVQQIAWRLFADNIKEKNKTWQITLWLLACRHVWSLLIVSIRMRCWPVKIHT